MTMRVKTPAEGAADVQEAAKTPPERQSAGVPADVLTAMSVRPADFDRTAPLDMDTLLDQDIAGWKPEPGDKVIGRVVQLELAGTDSTFGAYPMLTIRREVDGALVNVHAFHSVLRKELARRGVGIGDRVGLKYLGQTAGGDFGQYENYRVVVEAAPGAKVTTETVGR